MEKEVLRMLLGENQKVAYTHTHTRKSGATKWNNSGGREMDAVGRVGFPK